MNIEKVITDKGELYIVNNGAMYKERGYSVVDEMIMDKAGKILQITFSSIKYLGDISIGGMYQ